MMNDETDESNSTSFLDRVKESPRTVSALIIILIVAAAIYAFSGEPTPTTPELADNEEAATNLAEEPMAPDVNEEENADTMTSPAAPTAPPVAPREPLSQQQLQAMRQGLPEVQREGDAFVEKAQAGDGITHLARRATTRWLADNAAGYEITNEHRIYIEDYIQNQLGTDWLEVDDSRTISFALIAEAVERAGQLNESQLRNLHGYTVALN